MTATSTSRKLFEGKDAKWYANTLCEETGLNWRVMHPDSKDIYAYGCDFVLWLDLPSGGMVTVFRRAWPTDPSMPLWAFSFGTGDTMHAVADSFIELLCCPGVSDGVRGKFADDLPFGVWPWTREVIDPDRPARRFPEYQFSWRDVIFGLFKG